MNTLLANGEIPGLFEGDEYAALMTMCKEGSQRDGLMLDSHEELYKWFCNQIMRNLHVVFTMNPSAEGLKDRAATSPALFNRCVVDWLGDWSPDALYQVSMRVLGSCEGNSQREPLPSHHFGPLSHAVLPLAHSCVAGGHGADQPHRSRESR